MSAEESLQRFGLVPKEEDLPAIRALLAGEANAERKGVDREDDLALLCCTQLFSHGLLDDVLLIWEAKRSGFDLTCTIDVQLLCGAGLAATKEYLTLHPRPEAAQALAYICRCEEAGDFQRFLPESHLAHYRRYFESAEQE